MRLFRFGPLGTEKPGVFIHEKYYDLSTEIKDFDSEFFERGGMENLREILKTKSFPSIIPDRFACPIHRPSKIVCIGLNYKDHALEIGADFPKEPVIFLKSTTAIIGPYDDIRIPRGSIKTDWEVELALVIGKKASYIDEKDAMDYIAGYCLHNDISEREFQLERGGTWDKGKGCDTFAPIGPFLVSPDEIKEVHQLRLWLKVNGIMMQDGSTSNLIFNIPFLISYISQFMTLLPGDIVSTGTPAGVGLGMKPPLYLKPGDLVELGIDGIGNSFQRIIAFSK